MAFSSIRSMPSAVPGIGECNICFEVVPCLKVLECGHCLCIQCANRLSGSGSKPNIACPECRKETDCSRGLSYLKTKYFGKIRCDVCLERKEAEDMWWCAQCFQAFCSKCSIKEHSSKSHTITEWNKFEPVKFSVSYLNEVKYARQLSTEAEHNKKAVNFFMDEVGERLQRQLTEQPELDELKTNLITRYGTRFSSDEAVERCSGTESSSSEAESLGPKVVAKVLQLAGANVLETVLPTVKEQKFQVYFTVTPEEVANYLKSKIQYIPFDPSQDVEEKQPSASPAPEKVSEESFTRPDSTNMPVLQVIYNPNQSTVALRTATEVHICSLTSGKSHSIPTPGKQVIRSVLFDRNSNGELLLVLQSTARKYEWSLEAYQTQALPVSSIYSANLDIDPEDKVEAVHLAVSSEGTIYELRICQGNVSEIWKGVCSKKKGRTKLKESLVYEKPGARLTALEVVEPKHQKEKFFFCWDELSSCLYRLIVKDGRCEVATKLMHSSEPIPFALDKNMILWLFDPHMSQLSVSKGAVLNRVNVTFSEVVKFSKHGFCGIWLTVDSIVGINVDGNCIRRVEFKKSQ